MADRAIELLSPAGDRERLTMAVVYGADAVYLAGRDFGMRAGAGNFAADEMEPAIRFCHARGVRAYVTCNTIMRNDDIPRLPEFFERIAGAGADAVIVSDLAALMAAKKYAPGLDVHISTQMGVMNYGAASALFDMGARRVILAREMTLCEIAELRAKVPRELQLEAFVHGSMCVSFSGRCLISNYLSGRDANSGECAQPCRWRYHLVESERPGEYMEITEDGGTFLLNSRDLCMIEHIPEMLEAGIDSLKIEGRTKSAYYAAVVTNAYRRTLDAAMEHREPESVWLDEVGMISHREYSTGFYFDKGGPGQYHDSAMYSSNCDVVAVVEDCDARGDAVLTQRNRFGSGDALQLLTPDGRLLRFAAGGMTDMDGGPLDAAPHPMMRFKMRLPARAPRYSIVRKMRRG